MKTKLLNSTRGRYSNRSWFPEETPIWEKAYYTLYSSAAGKLSQKTLDELVAVLLSSDAGEADFPLTQRAERILDQFRLNKTQYHELIDLLPLSDLLHPNGGVGYRFLIHPNITDDVYQNVIDRIGNDKKMLKEFQILTESCIRSVINSLTTFTSYTRRWQQKKNANIITPMQYAHILRVLQRGENKLDKKL
jgi:hypothetical protein